MVNIQKQWWAALLLAIIAFAVPAAVQADDGDFDSPKTAFTWYQKGQGCMHLKLMTTNASPYRTLHSATYGVIGKDGKKTPVFQVAEYNSENSGYVISHFTNYQSGSLLYLTNDTYWKPLCLIYEGALQEHHRGNTRRTEKANVIGESFDRRRAGKIHIPENIAVIELQKHGITVYSDKDMTVGRLEELIAEDMRRDRI